MIQRILFSGLFLFCLSSISAQSKFEPNFVFVAKHTKNKPVGTFTNGTRVIVYLKSGEKVRGELLIYTDYIDVNYRKITLGEITAIKRNTNALWIGIGSTVAVTEITRRALDIASTEALLLSAGTITALSFLTYPKLVRKFKRKKGWSYSLRELGRYEQLQPTR